MKNTAPPCYPHSVFAASLAVLSPLGLIAAKHGHGGGSSTGWIVAAVLIVLAILGYLVFGRRSEPDEETLRAEDRAALERRLGPLYDADCRTMCFWLAQHSRGHQLALYDALNALRGTGPVQGDQGEA
jgi:hypothetical protein